MATQQTSEEIREDAGFGVGEVAELLATTPAHVRGWVRAGLVIPRRGPRGTLRFSFRDLAFLRRVAGLEGQRIAPRRVRRVVEKLRDAGQHELAALALDARRGEIVLREGGTLWSPETGQVVFDFAPRPPRGTVVELGVRRRDGRSADDWYRIGAELEGVDPEQAIDAYRCAVELDPRHADAAINLGCLQHERGRLSEAEKHYRAALTARPDATGFFDLAVVLEDQDRLAESRRAYEQALACDPACAEAHYNLASLCERAGDREGALRHLTAYRGLSR